MTEDQGKTYEEKGHVYLGDGVYASFDGYQIWLAVNDHTNKVVALEPVTIVRLIKYAMKNDMLEVELERLR